MPLPTRAIASMKSSLGGVADMWAPKCLANCNSHKYNAVDVLCRLPQSIGSKALLGVDFNRFLFAEFLPRARDLAFVETRGMYAGELLVVRSSATDLSQLDNRDAIQNRYTMLALRGISCAKVLLLVLICMQIW